MTSGTKTRPLEYEEYRRWVKEEKDNSYKEFKCSEELAYQSNKFSDFTSFIPAIFSVGPVAAIFAGMSALEDMTWESEIWGTPETLQMTLAVLYPPTLVIGAVIGAYVSNEIDYLRYRITGKSRDVEVIKRIRESREEDSN